MALETFARSPLEWWERDDAHEQLADLIAWLRDEGRLGTDALAEALHTCRKPWKYDAEHRQMLKARAAERAA